ncbi:MAG TPA: hypothetical protein VN999_07035 [Thermoanaerobaculia bacterium]|nr:hypothetical protein [Thermoanaerobaculia bacterium]
MPEGAPAAWFEENPALSEALRGIAAGDEIILITWLHRSRRDVLIIRPSGQTQLAGPAPGSGCSRSPVIA